MRIRSKLHKKLAVALITAMTAGTLAVPSLAAGSAPAADSFVPMKVGWHLVDGNWYYRNGSLRLRANEIFRREVGEQDKGKAFAFDENGVMYCDELFANPNAIHEVEEGEEPPKNHYAYPFGNLAENVWVKLDADGHMYDGFGSGDNDGMDWYYFDGKYDEETESGSEMVRGTEKKIKDNKYAFNKDGHMYSRSWVYLLEDPERPGKTVALAEEELEGFCDKYSQDIDQIKGNREYMAYYMAEGARVIDDWKIIGPYWYGFGTDGKVESVQRSVLASDSDAEPVVTNAWLASPSDMRRAREADSIDIVEGYEEVEAAAGDTVILKFKVNLASDSNTKDGDEFRLSRHDVYGSLSKSGSFHVRADKSGVCTVEYTPKLMREEEIRLYVDEVESDPVLITPKVTADAIDSVLSGWQEDGFTSSQVRDDLMEALSKADDAKKAELHEALTGSSYEELAGAYITEKRITESLEVDEEAQEKLGGGKVKMTGGALNADEEGNVDLSVKADDPDALTQPFANKVAFDINILLDGEKPSGKLVFPVVITMPVPVGYNAANMKLYHIHDGEEEEVGFTVKDGAVTFVADSFSTFVFAQNEALDDNSHNQNGGGSGSGSGSGGSGSSGQSAGAVYTDAKRGQVNSLTGIITGSGDGYSKWEQVSGSDGTTTWKLRYADGTYAAGAMVTREDGTSYERYAWELVNGAWYAFGADGNAKSGLVYDTDLGGYFCLDINVGMKTGWVLIQDRWHYFNPNSDGKKGIMLADTWVDGWYVDKDGVWDGKDKAAK